MEKDLIKQFNLPSYVKNKTYADASKAIEKKFKDRTDATAQQTKEELLGRLAKAQEYTKMQEALAANAGQVPDMMNGQIPAGMEEFTQNQAFMGGMFGEDALAQAGGIEGIAGGVTDIAGSLLNKNEIDTSGATTYDAQAAKAGRTAGAIGGGVDAISGLATGNFMQFGKGLFDVGKSLIGGKKEQEEMNQGNTNANTATTTHLRSDFGYGGKMYGYGGKTNDYAKGSNLDDIFAVNPNAMMELDNSSNVSSAMFRAEALPKALETPGKRFDQTDVGRALGFAKENIGEISRLAPIIGNLTDKIDKPTTRPATKVTGRYARQPFDLNYAQNQLDQQANEGKLASELSGGDMGAARNMATALYGQRLKASGDLNMKDQMANRQDEQFGTQIDQGNAQFNAMQDERYIDRAARDTGAYETAKANRRTALYEDIGKLGKESGDRKLVREMFGYKWNGKYWTDKSGKAYTSRQVDEAIGKQQENDNMFGGYLKKK